MTEHRHILALLSLVLLVAPSIGHAQTPKEAYADAVPAVVQVLAFDGKNRRIGQASGFLLAGGKLVTSEHVLAKAYRARVLRGKKLLAVQGVTARAAEHDLILLQVDGKDLPALALAEQAPEIGTRVIAIGSPGGLANTLSEGIISGRRKLTATSPELLQTTAEIAPGSSGGPLLTLDGKVVGVVSLHLATGKNLGFAVPAERVRTLVASAGKPVPLQQLDGPDRRMLPLAGKEIQERLAKYDKTLADLATARQNRTEDHPTVQRLRRSLADQAAALLAGTEANVRELKARDAELQAAEKQIAAARQAIASQLEALDAVRKKLSESAQRPAAAEKAPGRWADAQVGQWVKYRDETGATHTLTVVKADKTSVIIETAADNGRSQRVVHSRKVPPPGRALATAGDPADPPHRTLQVAGRRIRCDVYQRIDTIDGKKVPIRTFLSDEVPGRIVRLERDQSGQTVLALELLDFK